MKVIRETSLADFDFWAGAIAHDEMLTTEELEELDATLDELYPEGFGETAINDLMWFDFDPGA